MTASQNDLNNLLGDEDNGNMMKRWMARRGVEESGVEECNSNTTEASFVESSASQNDLHAVG